jgi:Predicted membrane protein (DUF2157)
MRMRHQILIDWMERDFIAPENLYRTLCVTGVFPSGAGWRRFLDQLLLWLGALMLTAGVIYFLAYNWNDLGRFAKFGLVEALIAGALIVLSRIGLDHIAGKVTLLAASLFVGALLALIGQTYQTGADTRDMGGVDSARGTGRTTRSALAGVGCLAQPCNFLLLQNLRRFVRIAVCAEGIAVDIVRIEHI